MNTLTTTSVSAGTLVTDTTVALLCSDSLVCDSYLSCEDGDIDTLTTTVA